MKSFSTYLTEATIKQKLVSNPTIVDPALLTFDEYYRIANHDNKFHSSDAYDGTEE